MEQSLADQRWELKGYWPWVPLKGVSMEIGDELLGVTEWMPATVPGGVHRDLFAAGLIADPYADLNSLSCEWVENRWWVYRASFDWPAERGERIELVCKGLDYEALVYLNGIPLGEHKGMYHPAVFDVTAIAAAAAAEGEPAELRIILKQAPDEMAQIGKTSQTFTQKSRFNYKWDFSTRLVNVGVWDDVALRVSRRWSFADAYVRTDVREGEGFIDIEGDVRLSASALMPGEERPRVTVVVADPDGATVGRAEAEVGASGEGWRASLRIAAPKLWYPNGYGEQPLYTVTAELTDAEGRKLDERSWKTGIRSLRYRRNEGSPDDALPYTFVVNGKRIYIKGANMTPLDHLYGNVTEDRYDWIVHLAKTANLNMLRIWGGGLIEKPHFYELCDRHGILIWQEFVQSSSGVDNEPSKRPEFLELLRTSAITALKDRRNHVALAVWSGGNELMSAPDTPSTYEDANLAMLKALVAEHDPQRLFLPTSASGPVQYITEEKGVSHDIHGHWKYQGNPYHYMLYAGSDSLFHSEFGVDGLSSMKSLAKFVSEAHLRPTDMKRDPVWRHHGEWWDTYERDAELFGEPDTLASFVDRSQWIQAEGLRFILEANRRRKFENSGSIVWQLNEPWPNVSCTNLVDYYQELKMAYYWARSAFEPNHVSLDYRKLNYRVGERLTAPVYVHRSGEPAGYRVTAQLLDVRGTMHGERTFAGKTEADRAVCVGLVEMPLPSVPEGLVLVRLKLEIEGEPVSVSQQPYDYFFSVHEGPVYAPALNLGASARLEVEPLTPWQRMQADVGLTSTALLERTYRVTNRGETAALHVHAQEATDDYWMAADDAFRTLLPGESMTVRASCLKRPDGLFERAEDRAALAASEPEVRFRAFNAPALVPRVASATAR